MEEEASAIQRTENGSRRPCSRSGPARRHGQRTRTAMPDNGARRTCSRSGPARLATYVDLRLASRPIAVPRIASRSPPYTSTYGAVGTALLSTCGGVRWGATGGWGGVASDNRSDSNHFRLGASAEGRLAWPQASSPSGHTCKPTRPSHPPVAPHRTPGPTATFASRPVR
jgi:hypothetical protein